MLRRSKSTLRRSTSARQLLLIVGRAFLERRRRVVAVLQRGEPVSEDLITLDSAIEFLLLTNEYVAQFLQTALEVSDADFKIVEARVFSHGISGTLRAHKNSASGASVAKGDDAV